MMPGTLCPQVQLTPLGAPRFSEFFPSTPLIGIFFPDFPPFSCPFRLFMHFHHLFQSQSK